MPERYSCPSPDCGKSYASLGGLKTHMARMHGGYTPEEIATASAEPTPPAESVDSEVVVVDDDGAVHPATQETAPPPPPPMQSDRPKVITRRSRELNDTLNSAIQLAIKHLTRGIDDAERQQLDYARREITAALVGVEFDFDEKLIVLRSKIWLLVSVILLYAVEKLPTFADMFKMLKKETAKKEPDAPE